MRFMVIFVLLGVAGCATSEQPIARVSPPVARKPSNLERSTVARVTQYELGSYRYPAVKENEENESAVLRVTRVPPEDARGADGTNILPAYDPLPPSAELRAEIAAQHEITEQLRAMKAAVAATEKKASEQYSLLLSRSEEVLKLQQQLTAQRARLRETEAQLREKLSPPTTPTVAANSTPASTSTQGIKW